MKTNLKIPLIVLGAMMLMTNLAAYFLERLKETRQEVKIHFRTLLMSTRS